jgi:hypothetical protein
VTRTAISDDEPDRPGAAFWAKRLARLPRVPAAQQGQPPASPAPVDLESIATMDDEQYAAMRSQLGMRNASDFLGIAPSAPRPPNPKEMK